jgi:hypothetical protein
MQSAKPWLILTVALFSAWIGYLAYLAYHVRQEAAAGGGRPVVLSRPQFLVADLVVIAALEEDRPKEALVKEVRWARHGSPEKWQGQAIVVENLGPTEPGEYILALANGQEPFRVAPIPPSPGFPSAEGRPDLNPARIYPSNPFTLEQLEAILAELRQR